MTHLSSSESLRFGFVCAANRRDVLNERLLASPCLQTANVPRVIEFGAASAAEVFNAAVGAENTVDWWIWIHQDVYLPGEWLASFRQKLAEALGRWENLAVVGAYGVSLQGDRGGNVLDRGKLLCEPLALPCPAQSLDELLIAVRADSGLLMDPGCGFDFYASDIVQQALEAGFDTAILDIYCEHWSDTPQFPPYPEDLLLRIKRSAEYFEEKWLRRLPILTPCMNVTGQGAADLWFREILAAQREAVALVPEVNLMKLIIVGNKSSRPLSDELAYAASQMRRSLPLGVLCLSVEAISLEALVGDALAAANEAGLADGDAVLLLRHSSLWWAPGTLERLVDPVRRGASAAMSYDLARPCPVRAPDYLTLRGIERYVKTLDDQAPVPHVVDDYVSALTLTTAGHLRSGRWRQSAVLVPSVYAHDFSGYHQGRREEVLPLIPRTVRRTLDVGGGEGGFLDLLKHELGCETHLAEYSPAACEVARAHVDHVWPGDFLSTEFDRQFDCVSMLEVLEHATSPLAWLEKAAGLLRPGGCLVASIPNVGHWSVVADLLEGRWDYAASGIHCITHLRFFTRHGIAQLMSEAGLEISEIRCTRIDPPAWFDVSAMASTLRLDAENLATYAFLIVARPIR